MSGESLGVLAMGAINEIMSKNCVPHDFEDFLLQMFRNTFHLLQRLVREEPNTTSRLQLLDPRCGFGYLFIFLCEMRKLAKANKYCENKSQFRERSIELAEMS